MKFFPVFFCFLFIFAPGEPPRAEIPDSATGELILSVQSLLFNDKFQKADSLCQMFIASYPNIPIGHILLAGTKLGEMSDLEDPLHSEDFRKLIDTSLALCNSKLNSAAGRKAAFYHLWRGHAHAYRSLFESRFGSFTSAIKHGFKAHDDYQNGLKNDSTLYDLYFGLGNYHFWKSVKAGLLRTIGIINNDIDQGIKELHLAADSGEYFAEAARNSLIWIRLEQKEYDSVISAANEMLKKYPESRTLRWPLAVAFFENRQFDKSAEHFLYLSQHFDYAPGNYFNLIECDYRLYLCFEKLERQDKADEILKKVSEYRNSVPRATQRSQLAKLNFLRRELKR